MYGELLLKWLNSPVVDAATKKELKEIQSDAKEVESRFLAPLTFGTGGLRGVLGAGINRMNRYTVRHATQGLANLILKQGDAVCDRGVVVGYDCRNGSAEFAREVCRVLVANGIRAYRFDELRPTPEVSFAIRELGCIAGVNITASHNPKEYNGYKAYWEDGAQLDLEQAEVVYNAIQSTDIFEDVKVASEAEAAAQTVLLGRDFDEKFLEQVMTQQINREVVSQQADMAIVYTPFHGTGYRLVPEVLKRAGFRNVTCVPEQMVLDGNFPTVASPNPENKEGFTLAMRLADQVAADFIIGTDPDADRLGVVVRNETGEFVALTGNQTGVILLDYVLRARQEQGTLPANACAIKTIVTSEMAARVCEKYGVTLMNVLTGFKFIGEKIKEFEQTGEYSYVFGYEESYGYLTGTYARDKDGVAASLLIAEVAAWYRSKSMTLWQALQALYAEYGWHREVTVNIAMPGLDGMKKTAALMASLRKNVPQVVAGQKVMQFFDLEQGAMGLPRSNVVYYALEDRSVVVVRPSGTEPKVKVYFMVSGTSGTEADRKAAALKEDFFRLANI